MKTPRPSPSFPDRKRDKGQRAPCHSGQGAQSLWRCNVRLFLADSTCTKWHFGHHPRIARNKAAWRWILTTRSEWSFALNRMIFRLCYNHNRACSCPPAQENNSKQADRLYGAKQKPPRDRIGHSAHYKVGAREMTANKMQEQ